MTAIQLVTSLASGGECTDETQSVGGNSSNDQLYFRPRNGADKTTMTSSSTSGHVTNVASSSPALHRVFTYDELMASRDRKHQSWRNGRHHLGSHPDVFSAAVAVDGNGAAQVDDRQRRRVSGSLDLVTARHPCAAPSSDERLHDDDDGDGDNGGLVSSQKAPEDRRASQNKTHPPPDVDDINASVDVHVEIVDFRCSDTASNDVIDDDDDDDDDRMSPLGDIRGRNLPPLTTLPLPDDDTHAVCTCTSTGRMLPDTSSRPASLVLPDCCVIGRRVPARRRRRPGELWSFVADMFDPGAGNPYPRLVHPLDRGLFVSFAVSIFYLAAAVVAFCPSLVIVVVILPVAVVARRVVSRLAAAISSARAARRRRQRRRQRHRGRRRDSDAHRQQQQQARRETDGDESHPVPVNVRDDDGL